MKESLLGILRCPVCGADAWTIEGADHSEVEILEGRLRCGGCHRDFPIAGGAVDLVPVELLTEVQKKDRNRCAESDRRVAEKKRRGEFLGAERMRECEYIEQTAGRTGFLFHDIEYDSPDERWVLDLGCGEPVLANRFARLGFNVVALDFVTSRLDSAHAFFQRDGTFFERVAGLMAKLPLADKSMDIVFSHASLHHATPLAAGEFRWSDPTNLLDTLREVKRVLKPDGLFLVSGEGEYPEEIGPEDRRLEQEARETGCYEAFYKRSEYEWAFSRAGIHPDLWAQYNERRLYVATFLGGRYRRIVTPGDSVNPRSAFLLRAPGLKREIDSCLKGWARIRPWPGGRVVPRAGAEIPADDCEVFVEGWQPVETDIDGAFRWLGREPAVLAVELDYVPGDWFLEFSARSYWVLGEFEAALFLERDGHVVAKGILHKSGDPTEPAQVLRMEADLEAGCTTARCITDGRMRLAIYFNGDYLRTVEPPPDGKFHPYTLALPAERVRRLNQITFQPAYALRPCDCMDTQDDRWLSCSIRNVRIGCADRH